jgi:hypothetical protein
MALTNHGSLIRLTFLMLVLTSGLVAGCAGHSVDCSMGAGQNGCVPGTGEFEEMTQQKQDALTSAEIDDARCQAFGEAGSAAYAECRRKMLADKRSVESSRGPQTGTKPPIRWTKFGYDHQQFEADWGQCQKEAAPAQCMQVKGYVQDK